MHTTMKGCATESAELPSCWRTSSPEPHSRGTATRPWITTPQVAVPPANTTLNGLHCPACYSVFTHHCSEEIIDCTGAQTQCIHISGTVKTGETTVHTTMKRCATESACTNIQQFKGAFGGFRADLTTAECRPASRAASMAPEPSGLILPALVTVLLANVLS
ncbi:phospholipase A2 inhibitor subunit gamma B-like [Terrapene carolina triunguis]|uniref:phospholipase A2 inhibitor subunit gamma B-like n=1 Tax=Terrapene triunguis TaxID=2587831 RepID=UPI000CEF5D96|nr:phospholipase A2 inhibitor subunit gamma B-like [Terrapene carolina triunguis]